MRVVVLGDYGSFGARICCGLGNEPGVLKLFSPVADWSGRRRGGLEDAFGRKAEQRRGGVAVHDAGPAAARFAAWLLARTELGEMPALQALEELRVVQGGCLDGHRLRDGIGFQGERLGEFALVDDAVS
jgi:hypothetical protein